MSSSIIKKNKIWLLGSILISILTHIAEVHFFKRQSLWFSTPKVAEETGTNWTSSMEKKERNQILKEVFQFAKIDKSPHPESTSVLIPKMISEGDPWGKKILTDLSVTCHFDLRDVPSEKIYTPILAHRMQKTPLIEILPKVRFPLPVQEYTSLLPHLPKELLLPKIQVLSDGNLRSPAPLEIDIVLKEASSEKLSHTDPAFQKSYDDNFISKTQSHKPPAKIERPTAHPNPKIPSLSELQTTAHSHFFDTELVFHEQEDGSYIFALTLIPHSDLKLSPLKQNYVFLVDRSNSIQGDRLNATKSAVRKAIEEIDAKDRFNIIAFDQKIDKLSPSFIHPSSESLSKVQSFLNKIELGSFFSQGALYKPLFLTIPPSAQEDEVYTAILITDGENLAQRTAIQSLIEDWTRMNQGKVVLYALGMNDDAHFHSLDTIAALNRGKTFSSTTKRGIKRKLLKIMKSIQTPIAKNVTCKAISRSPDTTVEIFPQENLLPYLYQNEPYVVLGKVSNLDDFIIFVQGRLNGERLHIKKNISFANAKRGSDNLLSEWAQQKAYSLYQQYLHNQDHRFLAEAKSLITTYGLDAF